MATAAQAAAGAFLAILSSSTTHHTTTSSSLSFLASPVLPASIRAAGTAVPPLVSRYRGRRVAAVVAQLPTTHPEVAAGDKKIRWSSRAVRSFAMAELEARKMRYPTTGTEGLLMGILVEGTSGAAKLLRANGITLLKVREEAANVLGKSEMFYFSPMHPPLTEAAQRALDWAVSEKMKSASPCACAMMTLNNSLGDSISSCCSSSSNCDHVYIIRKLQKCGCRLPVPHSATQCHSNEMISISNNGRGHESI